MPLNINELSVLVRQRRAAEKLSLRKLSKLTGVSFPTLSRIENGKAKNLELETADRLANWLKVSLEQLLRPPQLTFDFQKEPEPESEESMGNQKPSVFSPTKTIKIHLRAKREKLQNSSPEVKNAIVGMVQLAYDYFLKNSTLL